MYVCIYIYIFIFIEYNAECMINMINDILGDLSSKGYDRKVQKLRPAFLAEVHRNLWSRSGRRKAGGGGYQDPVPSLS